MKTSATNRYLRALLKQIAENTLIPRPEFQRRLVWSNKDKLSFIQTVLDEYPFPEIYIASGTVDLASGEGDEMLVDGQQRITTLYQYFIGDQNLKLNNLIPAYKDLTPKQQTNFLQYDVVIRDLGIKSIEEIKKLFQKINSTSYSLNGMEILNSRYAGEFKTFAECMVEHPILVTFKLFNAADYKRMGDTKFCASLLATILGNYFNLEDGIEEYLEKYDEDFPIKDRLTAEVNETLKFIQELNLDEDSAFLNKTNFFTLFVEVYKGLYKDQSVIDAQKTKHLLTAFMNDVGLARLGMAETPQANEYHNAAQQGVNSRSNRITRGKIIQQVLHGTLQKRVNDTI